MRAVLETSEVHVNMNWKTVKVVVTWLWYWKSYESAFAALVLVTPYAPVLEKTNLMRLFVLDLQVFSSTSSGSSANGSD